MASVPIPVIDLSADDDDDVQTAARLVDAAADDGFIYIRSTGRGIVDLDVQAAFEAATALFAAPLEDKMRCAIQRNNYGWSGMHTEMLDPRTQKTGDSKEAFNFGGFINHKAQQPIPAAAVPHEAAIAEFRERCHALCLRILHLFGVGLGLTPPDFFSSAHRPEKGPSGTILRFLRYPPRAETPDSQEDIRAGAHSDYGSITLLFRLRGQAGLQILTRSGKWTPVPVIPPGTRSDPEPPILVNIGDLLSYWTNGLFRSTVHRVVFQPQNHNDGTDVQPRRGHDQGQDDDGEKETEDGFRYSIAFFCHPVDSTPLTPVPCERVEKFVDEGQQDQDMGNPYARRKVLTAREHLVMRLAETYGRLYEEGDAGAEGK